MLYCLAVPCEKLLDINNQINITQVSKYITYT